MKEKGNKQIHCRRDYILDKFDGKLLAGKKEELRQGRGEVLVFYEGGKSNFTEEKSDSLISKIKFFLKKNPLLFSLAYYLLGAYFVGKNAKHVIKGVDSKKLIINLGAGTKRIRDDVINIDFFPFDGVDVVADITNLPLSNNSVDVVINEFVLEHTADPELIINEMKRIMKPGALLYLSVPFVATFHSVPNDYYRWTKQGLRELAKDFKELELGVRCGPTSAVVYVLSEWLGTIFCFGSSKLQQILFIFFMILLSPIKLLDFFVSKLPGSEKVAYGFYFIGRKL